MPIQEYKPRSKLVSPCIFSFSDFLPFFLCTVYLFLSCKLCRQCVHVVHWRKSANNLPIFLLLYFLVIPASLSGKGKVDNKERPSSSSSSCFEKEGGGKLQKASPFNKKKIKNLRYIFFQKNLVRVQCSGLLEITIFFKNKRNFNCFQFDMLETAGRGGREGEDENRSIL